MTIKRTFGEPGQPCRWIGLWAHIVTGNISLNEDVMIELDQTGDAQHVKGDRFRRPMREINLVEFM